mmetsp:Transcript_10800/g.20198  ORF Transcript_10800/g.20198 Transcript_10800/m.20198 type:complete len:625 (-) Transcript_10800:977-2851(-)|eukprot:CAMPEP_0176487566 /NCGR_PEP_ID=MMETSP0200_2-20121128/6212_1 /TAXON_ID=947934 /ORGANISM="Chaetoceros sp., Strain GSL56" /LENGTH=624 /DNA_ID=CAMNT_0017884427 /DNA_START=120 /DNA_END=1994 /DNA_ORIENTATION=+
MNSINNILTLCVLILLSFPLTVHGEIKTFAKTQLPATSSYIQFTTGYLVDPGYVDLTNVKFIAEQDEPSLNNNVQDRYDDNSVLEADDDYNDKGTRSPTGSPTISVTASVTNNDTEESTAEGTYNSTELNDGEEEGEDDDEEDDDASPSEQEQNVPKNNKDTQITDDYYDNRRRVRSYDETVIDVIFFHEPSDCVKKKAGCDWAKLGIGSSDNEGNIRWCCADDAIDFGLCTEKDFGRLIINKALFGGEHRPVTIPTVGAYEGRMNLPMMDTKEGTGQYTLVLANCNDYGRAVSLDGQYLWRSKGGFLPGDLFGEWHFITFLTLVYVALLFWYGSSMYKNKDSIIGIQKWILGTIVLGLIVLIFKGIDFMEWNQQGERVNFVMYFWITVGVLKGAISRCLLVMVSLGWGVIRDTLGDEMKKIILLGVLYSVFAFVSDIAAIVFEKELQILSNETEREIYDIFAVLTLATAVIDVIFYMWILDSLNSTMQYLENMNQTMKLRRYLRLRLILLFSILFAICWSVFGIVDTTMDDSILGEAKEWIVQTMWDVNYIFVLVSIALLWKPDPRAKEFAYVMELPSIGGDMMLETSIGSPDDEDEDGVNVQYSDAMTGQDTRFAIDDAVPS